ncbi:uncharacterized protein C8Q71DRAFT_859238 [Rhodofomes roseus]|uniref:Uncharacterized protein n=1 Tax=Rhodofomes roseus TaxID=34475 RepID=A0ABQ8KBF7_9APHY|nr:uncharacterized protein C8Q71DRAFT_859238 [Rhodofomes roseus]KAH9834891.1 hypothetical protein C8Q71DRAFT_859238 [Rhodofomes roseus]
MDYSACANPKLLPKPRPDYQRKPWGSPAYIPSTTIRYHICNVLRDVIAGPGGSRYMVITGSVPPKPGITPPSFSALLRRAQRFVNYVAVTCHAAHTGRFDDALELEFHDLRKRKRLPLLRRAACSRSSRPPRLRLRIHRARPVPPSALRSARAHHARGPHPPPTDVEQ